MTWAKIKGDKATETIFLASEWSESQRTEFEQVCKARSGEPRKGVGHGWYPTDFDWTKDHIGPIVVITWER